MQLHLFPEEDKKNAVYLPIINYINPAKFNENYTYKIVISKRFLKSFSVNYSEYKYAFMYQIA